MVNIFTVRNGQPMPSLLCVPDTHWYLVWDSINRTFCVKDCCGYINWDLSREVKKTLRNWSADAFHSVGFFLQTYTMRLAS